MLLYSLPRVSSYTQSDLIVARPSHAQLEPMGRTEKPAGPFPEYFLSRRLVTP
jgi:hypothetical protein